MRVAAVSACAISSLSFTPKVLRSPCTKHLLHHGCTLLSKSDRRRHSIRCSIKTPAAEHFGDSNNLATHLNTLTESLRDTFTEKLKEFPWKKARSIVAERLLILVQKALKWSLLLLFTGSFLSDVFMAVSANRELLIPLGLFTGVVLADFFKESFQEFFKSSMKDKDSAWQFLGVGSIFVFVKFLALFFNVQGRTLLSHIGNGGLMQVLWLAREPQGIVADVEMQELQARDTTSSED